MLLDLSTFVWTRQPKAFALSESSVSVTTLPRTGLSLTECAWKPHDCQQPD